MSGEVLDAETEAKLDKAINEGLAQWLAAEDRRENPYTVVARAAYRVGMATWAKELAGQAAALVAERDAAYRAGIEAAAKVCDARAVKSWAAYRDRTQLRNRLNLERHEAEADAAEACEREIRALIAPAAQQGKETT